MLLHKTITIVVITLPHPTIFAVWFVRGLIIVTINLTLDLIVMMQCHDYDVK